MRVDENWQARVCMSVSSTLIARLNKQWELIAWELTRVFLLFSISLFLLVASTLLFLRFLTLVKLLTVRVITPTVTCRWYVIIFLFSSSSSSGYIMTWKSLASPRNSLRLSCNSHDRSNEPNLSSTLIKIWTSSKLLRVHESWWELAVKRERELGLSTSFDQALRLLRKSAQKARLRRKFEGIVKFLGCLRLESALTKQKKIHLSYSGAKKLCAKLKSGGICSHTPG